MDWLMSANGKVYDHASAFQKWGFIDWRQGDRKYSVGDTVYIYCTKPLKRVMYKTLVVEVRLTKKDIVDDKQFWYDKNEFLKALDGYFMRIRLIEQVNRVELSLEQLQNHGLKSAPQGPIKLKSELK